MSSDCLFGIDLPSITESIYLGIHRTEVPRDYNILVNPESTTYIIRKTVILNIFDYPEKSIKELLKNECRIISRVFINDPEIEYSPYLFRYSSRIVWNGEIGFSWSLDSGILHISKLGRNMLRFGERGESDYLGFLAHQVGIHVYPGPYQDLDLVKIKKGRW